MKITVDEKSEKMGKKGLFYKLKMGKQTFNASREIGEHMNVGGTYDMDVTEKTYEFNGEKVTSRWLVNPKTENTISPATKLLSTPEARQEWADSVPDSQKTAGNDPEIQKSSQIEYLRSIKRIVENALKELGA